MSYSNSFHAPFIFDDRSNIVDNPGIRDLSKITGRLFHQDKNLAFKNDPSRPLVYLTFALNYDLGGMDPAGYHWLNFVLHTINILLIFLLTLKLVRGSAPDRSEAGTLHFVVPLLTASFFALHPVQTEAVTYISHRSDSMAALFYLASLLAFLMASETDGLWIWISAAGFICALFSKQTATTLPAMALASDYLFVSGRDIRKWTARARFHAVLWSVLGAYLLFRLLYIGQIGDPGFGTYRKWTHFTYALTQVYVIKQYLSLILLPVGQCIDHWIQPFTTPLNIAVATSAVAFAAVASFLYFIFRNNGWLRAPTLFAGIWFLVTLMPTSSILPIDDAMAERRLYLPGLGWCLILAALYGAAFMRYHSLRKVVISVLLVHLIALGVFTHRRNNLYADPQAMWESAARQYPQNPRAYENLAVHHFSKGNFTEAAEYYEKVLQLNPEQVSAYNNLGAIYDRMGYPDRAVEYFKKSISLNPNLSLSHRNLAKLYYRQQKYQRSAAEFETALSLSPDDPALRSEMESARKRQ